LIKQFEFMGGMGSGRRSRSDAVGFVESCLKIDIRGWQRERLLEPNRRFSHCWRKNQAAADCTVNVEVREDWILVLTYEIWRLDLPAGPQWDSIQLRVGLTFTRCNYGGKRPWFVCPMPPGCGRRVAILYLDGLSFLCRDCHALAYASQRMNRPQRASHRIQKIRTRLMGLSQPLPEKPARMRWATYQRLIVEAVQAERGK
jgi:hypothetical protein